ncbi:MAG: endonuclease/exonuclease/phosphatase family protein [Bacteroidales bacterium]|jgi:hypothetical protein|nr:endonuclease/exonuclease/phosphatase family protein [Bacteroidales bacterium]
MKVFFWNIGEDDKTLTCTVFKNKLKIIKAVINQESPDIFCIIEGTKSELHNKLLIRLFKQEEYSAYYHPLMPKSDKYKGYFDFDNFFSQGLKIFYKKALGKSIIPLSPSISLYHGRLIKLIVANNIFIFLHRNRSADKNAQDQFISQIKQWIIYEPDNAEKNFYVLGDFNLTPWDSNYFDENTGYLESSIIEEVHNIRMREGLSLSFYNPIIQVLNSKSETNLGGTYYKNDKKYRWQILDYVLFQKYDAKTMIMDIITKIGTYDLINKNEKSKSFINYNFDHLPIKIELK